MALGGGGGQEQVAQRLEETQFAHLRVHRRHRRFARIHRQQIPQERLANHQVGPCCLNPRFHPG
jgi:hypothetical protein